MKDSLESPTLPDHWSLTIEQIGREGVPVAIIDNFAREPEAMLADARTRVFRKNAPFYPGIRAEPRIDGLDGSGEALAALTRAVFGYPGGFDIQECFYSLVTTPAEELLPMQCLPHFDGVDDRKLALLHYLCEPAKGGTGFYRHRSTGWETVTDARFPDYKAALKADVATHGMPPRRYPAGSDAMFERIGGVEAVFNRMVIYPGIVLHAFDMPEDFAFSPDADRGRLTVNTFLTPAGS
ncbi:DUF6445 family protein [Maricaulis sp.]|uniref:DUF6445 family protein n=1 Tax=Maricaulis sp. TaxID=1486257 RepID=UPI00260B2BE0|nr:DUF6445 family protein [Maricaulis sp.]